VQVKGKEEMVKLCYHVHNLGKIIVTNAQTRQALVSQQVTSCEQYCHRYTVSSLLAIILWHKDNTVTAKQPVKAAEIIVPEA